MRPEFHPSSQASSSRRAAFLTRTPRQDQGDPDSVVPHITSIKAASNPLRTYAGARICLNVENQP